MEQYIKHQVLLGKPVPLSNPNDIVHIPLASNKVYAHKSKDFNSFHVSTLFASYTNLSGPITHGIYTDAIIRDLARSRAPETKQEPGGSLMLVSMV